ncbi:MAG: hypothetical protein JWM59_739 [Verrucomicrobiales bacterium]|nr:hypothetical protein [Verrucomicrobiales bacterium]
MTTKLPLSRHTQSTTPTRPVFARFSGGQEDRSRPAAPAPQSPGFQLSALFGGGEDEAPPAPRGARAAPWSTGPYSASLSVGQQMLHARLAHGWTIEDVAFQTRIPHTLLRDLENDDLSNFANLTYAKGFLKLYSRHLELDISSYLEQFDTSAISAITGHEYIQTASMVRSLSAPAIAPDAQGNPQIRLLGLSILVGVVLIAIVVFLKFGHSSAPEPAPSTTGGVHPEAVETRQAGGSVPFSPSRPAGGRVG